MIIMNLLDNNTYNNNNNSNNNQTRSRSEQRAGLPSDFRMFDLDFAI